VLSINASERKTITSLKSLLALSLYLVVTSAARKESHASTMSTMEIFVGLVSISKIKV